MTEEPGTIPAARRYAAERGTGDDERALATRSPFVPLLLSALALAAWLAFQTVQLVREQNRLEQMKTAMQPQEEASAKLRASLDQLATATAKLAAEGNGNARTIVEQLRGRGITINPSGAASAPR